MLPKRKLIGGAVAPYKIRLRAARHILRFENEKEINFAGHLREIAKSLLGKGLAERVDDKHIELTDEGRKMLKHLINLRDAGRIEAEAPVKGRKPVYVRRHLMKD